MSGLFGNAGASAGAVNEFHANSDVDKSTISQHHTLGIQPNQASPGDHNHDGRNSRRINLRNLQGSSVSFVPAGGTTGTQPTFSGDPLFTGSYTLFGNLAHFAIDVDMDNITNFGTGQYYISLPFAAKRNYIFRDGCIHDISTNRQYSVSGHVTAGSTRLDLFSTSSNGQDVPFEHNVPFVLATADNFHIAGTYEILQ
jgi:hypothetical protein